MGRVAGFEKYKVQRTIEFNHDLQSTDFPVTDAALQGIQAVRGRQADYKATPEQLERARPFVERQLRFELATAAYGSLAATQVFNESDPQLAKGLDAMPRARELALAARRARARS